MLKAFFQLPNVVPGACVVVSRCEPKGKKSAIEFTAPRSALLHFCLPAELCFRPSKHKTIRLHGAEVGVKGENENLQSG